jgi:hypothetical protein
VNPLPFAQECVAGRWAQWKQAFDDSGVTTSCLVFWDH